MTDPFAPPPEGAVAPGTAWPVPPRRGPWTRRAAVPGVPIATAALARAALVAWAAFAVAFRARRPEAGEVLSVSRAPGATLPNAVR